MNNNNNKAINNILVVDDEVETAKTLVRHLKREGFRLESANRANEARQKIATAAQEGENFDLVISDVLMPENDGLELAEWIKSSHPQISILLISGLGDIDFLHRAIRPELDTFCLKPLTPDKMMSLITTIEHKRHHKFV